MKAIQYIGYTHTSKEAAIQDKATANKHHRVYVKDATFGEVCHLLESGSIVARVGDETDFVCLDVDETDIHIDVVRKALLGYPDIRVIHSASGSPYKYHILRGIPTIPESRYDECTQQLFDLVRRELSDGAIDYDRKADNFSQCIFGRSARNRGNIRLVGSVRVSRWVRKDEKDYIALSIKDDVAFPYTSSQYAHWAGLDTVYEGGYRFDVVVPARTNGKMPRIPRGRRFEWSRIIGSQLLLRARHLNAHCGYSITRDQYLAWYEYTMAMNVVDSAEFRNSPSWRSLLTFYGHEWDSCSGYSFGDLVERYGKYFTDLPKKPYRSRNYVPHVMAVILKDITRADGVVVLESRAELERIVGLYDITLRAAELCLAKKGIRPEYRKRRPNCLDKYRQDADGVYIPRAEVTPYIRKYCSLHRIRIHRI